MSTLKGMEIRIFRVLFLCGFQKSIRNQEKRFFRKGRDKMKIKMRDGSIQEAGFEEELGRDAFRHTTAHILAQAVKRLYPDTRCAIGPAIPEGFDNGIQDRIPLSKFYYDFDFTFRFSEENFPEVEAEMRKIVKENLQIRQFAVDRESAIQERPSRRRFCGSCRKMRKSASAARGNMWNCAQALMWPTPARSGHLNCCP